MNSLLLALGLLAFLALGFAAVRAYFGRRAFSRWLGFFASFTRTPSDRAREEIRTVARQRADLERRFAALVVSRSSLRAWLQLREADTDNVLTERIDAALRARPDFEAALQRLLDSPLRLDRGLALRHLGIAEQTSERTAAAALEVVELLASDLRETRPAKSRRPEQLPPLLFGAAHACEVLRERGHFVETAARELRLAVTALGRDQDFNFVVATLDHALAP